MNGPPSIHLTLLPILLLLLLTLIGTGTILGWVAASRIRHSEGSLYGLGFAAFAGMLFPSLMLIALPIFAFLFIVRISEISPSLTVGDATLLGAAFFATLAVLAFKGIQGGFRKILGKGAFRDSFSPTRNRGLIVLTLLLWITFGVLLFLQRPRPMGDALGSDSPDGSFHAEAGSWRRMRVFGRDELCYRFEIRDHEADEARCWEIPVDAKDGTGAGRFVDDGTIQWKPEDKQVVFWLGHEEVFAIAIRPLGIPPGAKVAGSGEIRVVAPD